MFQAKGTARAKVLRCATVFGMFEKLDPSEQRGQWERTEEASSGRGQSRPCGILGPQEGLSEREPQEGSEPDGT